MVTTFISPFSWRRRRHRHHRILFRTVSPSTPPKKVPRGRAQLLARCSVPTNASTTRPTRFRCPRTPLRASPQCFPEERRRPIGRRRFLQFCFQSVVVSRCCCTKIPLHHHHQEFVSLVFFSLSKKRFRGGDEAELPSRVAQSKARIVAEFVFKFCSFSKFYCTKSNVYSLYYGWRLVVVRARQTIQLTPPTRPNLLVGLSQLSEQKVFCRSLRPRTSNKSSISSWRLW